MKKDNKMKKKSYIFIIISIINLIVQLSDSPLKLSNWVSAIIFLVLSLWFLINNSNKNKKE